MSRLKIYNGNIITPYRIIRGGSVLVENGIIVEVAENEIDAPESTEIDAGGKYISPGFIDIHIHGGGGHDFMDCNEEAFLKIAETHARYGTTAMMPTTLSCEQDELITTPLRALISWVAFASFSISAIRRIRSNAP